MEENTTLSFYQEDGQLSLKDISVITNYGADIVSKIDIDNNKLSVLKSVNNDEVNKLIKDILNKVDDVDFNDLKSKSIWNRIFKKLHLKKFIQKYNSINDSIDDVQAKLIKGQENAEADNQLIEQTYITNKAIIPELDELIEYGKQKQEELANIDTSSFESFELQNYNTFVHQLTQKVNTLYNIRNILSQELVQLKIMEENNIELSNKITDINQYVIPLWKHNLSTILILENQSQNAKLVKAISDTTNKMITIQSELLYENSVAIANEKERGIVDLTTLKKSTDTLYKTLQDVKKIHTNSLNNQKIYENELEQLKDKIHQLYSNI
jgi:uncharacterized protein YaaN involved in tellurite resistance